MNVIAKLVIISSMILFHINTVQSQNNSQNGASNNKQTIEEKTVNDDFKNVEVDVKNLDLVLEKKISNKTQLKDLESKKEDLSQILIDPKSFKEILEPLKKDLESFTGNIESLKEDPESLVKEEVIEDSVTDNNTKVEDVPTKITQKTPSTASVKTTALTSTTTSLTLSTPTTTLSTSTTTLSTPTTTLSTSTTTLSTPTTTLSTSTTTLSTQTTTLSTPTTTLSTPTTTLSTSTTTLSTPTTTTLSTPTTTLSTSTTTLSTATTTLSTTTTTTSTTTTNDNSLDFSFRKCCKSQTEILHLAPSGKPVCETLHGLELPDLVPRNMGGEINNIPGCINGTLTVVDNFLHPNAEGYINVLNSDRTITRNVSIEKEDFCNDFAIEDGSFITTVALLCQRSEDVCREDPKSCINICCNSDHLCSKPKWEFFQDKHIISTHLNCNNSATNLTLKSDGVYLLDRKLNLGEYCVEPGLDSSPIIIVDNFIQVTGQSCMQPNIDYSFIMNARIVIAVLLCLSVVSLLFSLLIHLFVPELHASMFGWMKISHLFSMFIAFTILFGMFVGGLELVFNHNILCKILGFTMQYFFIASFFWVNVMSFDIWRTFRHIRGFNNNKTMMKLDQRRKFIYYSVYAWGSSFLVSAITILMESLPKDLTENLTTPNIGVHSCFFETNWSKMVYFHAPVSILLTANIIFFLMSSWSLMMGVWAPSASDRIKRQTKQRFIVVVELFFGMGFTWVAEIISWALSWGMGTHAILKTSIIFDGANALQGFIIFIIVVLKSRTIKSIKKFIIGIPVSAHNSIKNIERKFSKSTVISSNSSAVVSNTVVSSTVHRNP